jgi:hypothetical protein
MLDEGEDTTRHELCAADRRSSACHLGDGDHPAAGGDLDTATGTRRLDLVRPDITAGVDDDLYPVTLHEIDNVQTHPKSP